MPNTTDEYWDVDGESLQTLVRNIEQWGQRHGVPPIRGGDFHLPMVPGELWRAKVPGPRTITLAGWLVGDTVQDFRSNWRSLRNLLWRTDRQVSLTKRWRLVEGGSVYQATAKAQYESGLEPDTIGPSAAKFTVDMRLAFPYFKGSLAAHNGMSGSFSINVLGDDTTRLVTLQFSQAATLLNVTTGRELTVPDAATLNVETFDTTGSYENISVSGDDDEPFWFSLARGQNDLILTAGVVNISYTPLYV